MLSSYLYQYNLYHYIYVCASLFLIPLYQSNKLGLWEMSKQSDKTSAENELDSIIQSLLAEKLFIMTY